MCNSQSETIPDNQKNRLDYLGEIHNAGLNEGLKELYNSTVKKGINPATVDIEVFAHNFATSFMEKEILKREKVSDIQKLRENLQSLSHNSFSHLRSATMQETSAKIEESALTDFQKEYFNLILKTIDGEDNIAERLAMIENEVLNKTISDQEKECVLGLLAVSKHSFAFWSERVIENPETSLRADDPYSISLVEVNGDIFIALNGGTAFLAKFKKFVGDVALSDALGFAGGAVGALINPATYASGLVFGPGGVVLTVAGQATWGAISGSIVGAGWSIYENSKR